MSDETVQLINIKNLLIELGIKSTSITLLDDKLKIYLKSPSANFQYRVFIQMKEEGEAANFESPVFKTPVGNTEAMLDFQLLLSKINGTTDGYLTFAIVGQETYTTILKGVLPYPVSMQALYDILVEYEYFYENIISDLKIKAQEMGLELKGTLPRRIEIRFLRD